VRINGASAREGGRRRRQSRRTQLGRVEYALKGGRLNTDAIDNSAGVDTSDHEVNLKILLSGRCAAASFRGRRATRCSTR
jgi:NAD-specific glutamate dehydrogenase